MHDDMARELAFYHQGAAAAHAAIQHFEEAGASWRRPPDYYAESVKSDGHMSKVKEQLMYEQKLIEEAEQRCVAFHEHSERHGRARDCVFAFNTLCSWLRRQLRPSQEERACA